MPYGLLVGTPHCDNHGCPLFTCPLDVILRAVGRLGLGWLPRGLLPQERPGPGSQAHAAVLGDRPELKLARSCSYRDQESPPHSTRQCSAAEAGGYRNEVEPRPQALLHVSLTGPLEEDRDLVCWGGWPTQCPKGPASVSLESARPGLGGPGTDGGVAQGFLPLSGPLGSPCEARALFPG